MLRIQRIPFYLPQYTEFDTTQIGMDTHDMCGLLVDDYYEAGGVISFPEAISKYVFTSRFGDVIKEHIFVSPYESMLYPMSRELEKQVFYPIMIKSYKLGQPVQFQDPPILIRKGLERFHNTIDTYSNTMCSFITNKYLESIIKFYRINKPSDTFMEASLFDVIEQLIHIYNYYENEPRFAIGSFDVHMYADNLLLGKCLGRLDPEEVSRDLFDSFAPTVAYSVFLDRLTLQSLELGKFNPNQLKSTCLDSHIEIDNTAMNSNCILYEINHADNVLYAGGRYDGFSLGEIYEYGIYALYELFQTCPFTDVHLEYILQGTVYVLTQNTVLHNYYLGVLSAGIATQEIPWLDNVTREITLLIDEFSTWCGVYRQQNIQKVDVIIQDYHAVIVLCSPEKRQAIIFDLISLSLISRTLIFNKQNDDINNLFYKEDHPWV